MANVFISYSHADGDKVRRLVERLRAEGVEVWWDVDLKSGNRWGGEIEKEIDRASSVVIVWSNTSVKSHYVIEEALLALEREKAKPVRIDNVGPPFGFKSIHAVDLLETQPEKSPSFSSLLDMIRAGGPARHAVPTGPPEELAHNSTLMLARMLITPGLIVAGLAVTAIGQVALGQNAMFTTMLGSLLAGGGLMYAVMTALQSRR